MRHLIGIILIKSYFMNHGYFLQSNLIFIFILWIIHLTILIYLFNFYLF